MVRRVAAGVAVNIFDKTIVAVVQLVLVPILVLKWGLHTYGLWILLATAPTFLAMGDMGFATSAGTKMTMENARGNRDAVVRIFHSAWAAILSSSAVLLVAAALFACFFPANLFGEDRAAMISTLRITLMLLLAYGIVAIQGSIFFAAFRAAGLFALGALSNALIMGFENAVLIGTVLSGGGLVAAAQALLVGRAIGLICQSVLLHRSAPWLRLGLSKGSMKEARALLAPAGAVMLLPIAQACALQGTAIAVGAGAGQAVLPIFTATRTLSRVGLQLCWLLNSAIMPEFSAAAARQDRRAMSVIVLVTLAASAVLVVPYALGFGLFGQKVILLWTKHVIDAPEPLVLAMAGTILFGGIWFPASNLILAINRHASYTGYYLFFAMVTVPLTYVLSVRYGAVGGGLAMMLLDGVMLIVVAVMTQHLLVSWSELRNAVPRAFKFTTLLLERARRGKAST